MIRRTFLKSLTAAMALPCLPMSRAFKPVPAKALSPVELAMKYVGRVNDLPFIGFAPYKILCEGVTGRRDEVTDEWRVKYLFRFNVRASWIPYQKADFSKIPAGGDFEIALH